MEERGPSGLSLVQVSRSWTPVLQDASRFSLSAHDLTPSRTCSRTPGALLLMSAEPFQLPLSDVICSRGMAEIPCVRCGSAGLGFVEADGAANMAANSKPFSQGSCYMRKDLCMK